MNRIVRLFTASVLAITMTACPVNKTTLAALVTTLGQAAASVATIQGNPALAAQLQKDVAIAAQQIASWQKGSGAAMAIAAIGIVEADLQLFPQVGPYLPLIELALGTAQSIIAIIQAQSGTPPAAVTARTVHLAKPAPKNSAEFNKQWNADVVANGLNPALLR